MKLSIAYILAGSAAAFFHSTQVSRTSVATNVVFEPNLGIKTPLGFFYPLRLLNNTDQERFEHLCYIELKHRRITQLDFLGNIITPDLICLPGNIDYSGTTFNSIGKGCSSISGPNYIPQEGLFHIIIAVSFLELGVMKDVTGEGEFPGALKMEILTFSGTHLTKRLKFKNV